MIGWSEIRQAIAPTEHGRARANVADLQPFFLEQVLGGHYVPPDWFEVELTDASLPGVVGRLQVMARPLSLGSPNDSVTINVTHRGAQAIADVMGRRLSTARIEDVINEQASVRLPVPPWVSPDASLAQMERLSDWMATGAGSDDGIVSTMGKAWINSPVLLAPQSLSHGKATGVNYGWHTKTGGYPSQTSSAWRVLQQPGTTHTVDHTDRSQTLRLIGDTVLVEHANIPMVMPIDAVAAHPTLHRLVSWDGPVALHHPWLDQCAPLAEGGACPPIPGKLPPSTVPAGSQAIASRSALGPVVIAGALGVVLYLAARWWHG